MLFYQILPYNVHIKIQSHIETKKCKISAPAWNEKFALPEGSYSVSDIQDFE